MAPAERSLIFTVTVKGARKNSRAWRENIGKIFYDKVCRPSPCPQLPSPTLSLALCIDVCVCLGLSAVQVIFLFDPSSSIDEQHTL